MTHPLRADTPPEVSILDGYLTNKLKVMQTRLWMRHRTWHVLDDEMTDVLHAQLSDKVLVFLMRK